ncbi:DEAD/DEAH box helicase [Candidatus Riesia pediculicola]|uniref:DEAD/DEAH box helicase n=1 Tax=Candidatus Riesia pediculicola TaxID=401619 RepID=UPI0009E1A6FD|nr:DEAD/DEAH box helicase [Candidatus Riesia pediculicola]
MNKNCIQLEDLDHISVEKINKISFLEKRKLNRAGINSILDLIFYFPKNYKDQTKLSLINQLKNGEESFVTAKVFGKNLKEKKNQVEIYLRDHSGELIVKFFNSSFLKKKFFKKNSYIQVYGKAYRQKNKIFMIHPEYKVLNSFSNFSLCNFLTPIYPNISGIRQDRIHKIIKKSIRMIDHCIVQDLIPKPFNKNFIRFQQAIKNIHHPNSGCSLNELKKYQHPAQKRLIFEELLAFQLSFLKIKKRNFLLSATPLIVNQSIKKKIIQNLPYSLTNSQKNAIKEIESDLSKNVPMKRLLYGDVGAGKTIVALFSSLCAISNEKQVALMTPTEILAKQHVDFFKKILKPIGKRVIQLCKDSDRKNYESKLDEIKKGKALVIIGTHSIFQDKIDFCSLSLVIIDEQHRFGVSQRSKLLKKGKLCGTHVHQLIMTATPIPRTLSMQIYANLDASSIDNLHNPKRIPVRTIIISNIRRDELIHRIKNIFEKKKNKSLLDMHCN